MSADDRLVLEGLQVQAGSRHLVRGVGLTVRGGEVVGLVGPSGSGKTLTARALLGLVDFAPGVVAADLTLTCEGRDHRPYDPLPTRRTEREHAFREVRGALLGYLPQDAPGSLDPAQRVGRPIEAVAARAGQPGDARVWLERAGFSADEAPVVLQRFPHQLSGGMAQRVAIALALARGSRFLVADEPTTGLDAAVQRQLVHTFRRLADEGLGVLIVTHDLRWLAQVAHHVHILDQGTIAETLSASALRPEHATTEVGRRLLGAVGRMRSRGFP